MTVGKIGGSIFIKDGSLVRDPVECGCCDDVGVPNCLPSHLDTCGLQLRIRFENVQIDWSVSNNTILINHLEVLAERPAGGGFEWANVGAPISADLVDADTGEPVDPLVFQGAGAIACTGPVPDYPNPLIGAFAVVLGAFGTQYAWITQIGECPQSGTYASYTGGSFDVPDAAGVVTVAVGP